MAFGIVLTRDSVQDISGRGSPRITTNNLSADVARRERMTPMYAYNSLMRPSHCAASILLLSILALSAVAATPPKSSPTGGAQPAQPPAGQGNPIPAQTGSTPQGNTPPAGGAAGGGQTPPKSDAKTLTVDLGRARRFCS
jgi:hypothetical protein